MTRRVLITLALTILFTIGSMAAPPAEAGAETYGDYSMMFTRSAGQYWAGAQVAGQWAWSPASPSESWVSWGDPKTWPPSYREKFVHTGDWVLVDGWADNGTYYKLSTTTEWSAIGSCTGARTSFPPGGAQHYVRWTVPTVGYCMFAEGTITEQSSGKVVRYRHEQTWSPPAACPANPNTTVKATCVKQTERWSDDNGSPMAPRLLRDAWIAKGLGMAWSVRNHPVTAGLASPGSVTWRADGRFWWGW